MIREFNSEVQQLVQLIGMVTGFVFSFSKVIFD